MLMLTVSVCVGSSCHLKGAYGIIEGIRHYITQYGLEEELELKAHFCANLCQQAVAVKVGEEPCRQVDDANLLPFLEELMGRRGR